MTRMSKPAERRAISPRRPSIAGPKTGSLKDNLPLGYKEAQNALQGNFSSYGFIPKMH